MVLLQPDRIDFLTDQTMLLLALDRIFRFDLFGRGKGSGNSSLRQWPSRFLPSFELRCCCAAFFYEASKNRVLRWYIGTE
jgi:hypothetical protein